jgi:hypothetical protein
MIGGTPATAAHPLIQRPRYYELFKDIQGEIRLEKMRNMTRIIKLCFIGAAIGFNVGFCLVIIWYAAWSVVFGFRDSSQYAWGTQRGRLFNYAGNTHYGSNFFNFSIRTKGHRP